MSAIKNLEEAMRDWNLGSCSIVRRTHPYVEHARAQAERAKRDWALDLNLVFGELSDKHIAHQQKRVAGRNSDIEAALIDLHSGSDVDGSEASLNTVELIQAQLKP